MYYLVWQSLGKIEGGGPHLMLRRDEGAECFRMLSFMSAVIRLCILLALEQKRFRALFLLWEKIQELSNISVLSRPP
jgi:hypothetical protein